jgi:hypothetical protein
MGDDFILFGIGDAETLNPAREFCVFFDLYSNLLFVSMVNLRFTVTKKNMHSDVILSKVNELVILANSMRQNLRSLRIETDRWRSLLHALENVVDCRAVLLEVIQSLFVLRLWQDLQTNVSPTNKDAM